jgi:hypothetical protein
MAGWEKYLFLINLTKLTYNGEIGHYSPNLVLGSSSTMHQPLPHMLLLTKWLQKIGAKGIQKGVEFLCYYLPPLKWDPYLFFYRLEEGSYPIE